MEGEIAGTSQSKVLTNTSSLLLIALLFPVLASALKPGRLRGWGRKVEIFLRQSSALPQLHCSRGSRPPPCGKPRRPERALLSSHAEVMGGERWDGVPTCRWVCSEAEAAGPLCASLLVGKEPRALDRSRPHATGGHLVASAFFTWTQCTCAVNSCTVGHIRGSNMNLGEVPGLLRGMNLSVWRHVIKFHFLMTCS